MKKIVTLTTLGLLCLGLVACGDKKTTNKDTNTTTTTTTEVVTTIEPTTEIALETLVDDEKIIIVPNDNGFEATTKDNSLVWYTDTYDSENVVVNINEDAGTYIFEIQGAKEGTTAIDIIGENASERTIYSLFIQVDKDLKLTATCETAIFELEDTTLPETTQVDEDLSLIIQDCLTSMGEGNYPDPSTTNPIDMSNVDDMMYVLGVESLTGMEKGAVMEPMMSSIAYSLVVIKFDTNENAQAAATSLLETAPTEKWVCVMPDDVITKVVNDTYVILFMGPQSSIDTLK